MRLTTRIIDGMERKEEDEMEQTMTVAELKRKISILPDDYEVSMVDECVVAISKPIKPDNEVLDEAVVEIQRAYVDIPKHLNPHDFGVWSQAYCAGVQDSIDAVIRLKEEKDG